MSFVNPFNIGVVASSVGKAPPVVEDVHWDYVLYLNDFNTDSADNYGGSAMAYDISSSGVTLGTPAMEGTSVIDAGSVSGQYYADTVGASDFTHEAFVYRQDFAEGDDLTFCESFGYNIGVDASGMLFANLISENTNKKLLLTDSNPMPTAEWVYVCLERKGDTVRLYKGTVASGSASMVDKGTFIYPVRASNSTYMIGYSYPYDEWFVSGKDAMVDDVRLTAVARYDDDAGFPIPSVPFPKSQPAEVALLPKARRLLHFDASVGVFSDVAGTTPCADGDPVALWSNPDGQLGDAKQTSASNRPTFKTGGQNGLPYIKGESSLSQYFEDFAYVEPSGFTALTGKVIFAVLDNVNTTINHALFGAPQSSGSKNGLFFRPTDTEHIQFFKSGWRYGSFQTNPFLLTVNLLKWDQPDFRINGQSLGASNSGTFSSEPTSLEFLRCTGLSGEGGAYFDGHLYELIFYTGGLPVAKVNEIEAHLMTKYALGS